MKVRYSDDFGVITLLTVNSPFAFRVVCGFENIRTMRGAVEMGSCIFSGLFIGFCPAAHTGSFPQFRRISLREAFGMSAIRALAGQR